MAHVLITIVAPPAMEHPLLEALLEQPSVEAFSSSPGRSHGADPQDMTVAERVAGWQREVRVEVLVSQAEHTALLGALGARFNSSAVRYWVVPVVGHGCLSGLSD